MLNLNTEGGGGKYITLPDFYASELFVLLASQSQRKWSSVENSVNGACLKQEICFILLEICNSFLMTAGKINCSIQSH